MCSKGIHTLKDWRAERLRLRKDHTEYKIIPEYLKLGRCKPDIVSKPKCDELTKTSKHHFKTEYDKNVFELNGLLRDLPFVLAEIKKIKDLISKSDEKYQLLLEQPTKNKRLNAQAELVRKGKLELMLQESERNHSTVVEHIEMLKAKTKESIKRCPKGSRRNKKTQKCEKHTSIV